MSRKRAAVLGKEATVLSLTQLANHLADEQAQCLPNCHVFFVFVRRVWVKLKNGVFQLCSRKRIAFWPLIERTSYISLQVH